MQVSQGHWLGPSKTRTLAENPQARPIGLGVPGFGIDEVASVRRPAHRSYLVSSVRVEPQGMRIAPIALDFPHYTGLRHWIERSEPELISIG